MITMSINDTEFKRLVSALTNVRDNFIKEPPIMIEESSLEFKLKLIQSIVYQDFPGSYAPLSESYATWKHIVGGESGFWNLWGSLVGSIQISSYDKGRIVEINPSAIAYKNSSYTLNQLKPVWEYAFYGEFGRDAFSKGRVKVKAQPPRPLFVPLREEFADSRMPEIRVSTLKKIIKDW